MRRQRPLSQRTPHTLLPVIAEQIPDATPRHLNEIAFELDRMPWIDDAIRAEIRRMVALRRGEIQAHAMAARQLDRIRSLSARLDTEIDRLIEGWQALSTIDNDALTASLNHSRLILFLTSGCAVAGALAIAWLYVGRRVVRRITAIETSMRTIAAGDFDAQIPAGGTDEVTRMAEALAVFRDAMRRLAHLAHHDPLTGLLNRNGLTTVGATLIRDHTPGALIYFNLESFKDINDTFGHDSGDHILVEVAARLRTVAAEPWLLARLGGDDFAILAPDCDEATALTHAALIQGALTVPITSDVLTVDLRAAIGVVAYPAFGVTPHELLQRADMAMNAARTHEDAPIRLYEPALGTTAEHRKTVRAELRQALDGGQFHLAFQPKIEIASNQVIGVEALIRWAHLQRGAIPPCDFIPIAERSGLIQPLGAWVLEQSCHQAVAWAKQGIDLSVAVNFSASQFLQPDVVKQVKHILRETGLPPERLEIEITESVFLRGETDVLHRLRRLRDCGIGLALDDFGTGYSSLSYLKRLPVSCLKIDQSFVRDMFLRDDDTRVTSAIIRMAHDLGLSVVAEGIESDLQLDFFREAGCDIGQGYLFARPMAAAAIAAFIDGDTGPGNKPCDA